MNVMEFIKDIGLVPVVVLNDVNETIPQLKALEDGDVKVAEICFRTPCAIDCIKLACEKCPNVLVGAGTVINAKQAEDAIACGAKFIVSPGLSKSVDEVCKKHDIPYLPGVVTPTEIMEAIELGRTTVKFFPAGVFGGLKAIKAMGAAFPQVSFLPTGGVNNDNLKEFIECNKIYAVGGSWLCKKTYEETVESCKVARSIVKENR